MSEHDEVHDAARKESFQREINLDKAIKHATVLCAAWGALMMFFAMMFVANVTMHPNVPFLDVLLGALLFTGAGGYALFNSVRSLLNAIGHVIERANLFNNIEHV